MLRQRLGEVELQTQIEGLDGQRMVKVKQRERQQQVAEQVKIAMIKPNVEKLEGVHEKAD